MVSASLNSQVSEMLYLYGIKYGHETNILSKIVGLNPVNTWKIMTQCIKISH